MSEPKNFPAPEEFKNLTNNLNMSNKQESKDIKEITLYNFATLRNPEYINKEALTQNVGFICYNKMELDSENEVNTKVSIEEFDIETFLDFDELLFQNNNAGNKKELDSKGHIHYRDTDDEDIQIVHLHKFGVLPSKRIIWKIGGGQL